MDKVLAWMVSHPEFMLAVVWPVLTFFINAIFKPRSPEEYEAMHPYVRAVLKFTSALGVDPVKAAKAVKEGVTGYAESRHGAKK